jgi:hypothetical protein
MGEIELWRTLRTPCKVTVIELGPSRRKESLPRRRPRGGPDSELPANLVTQLGSDSCISTVANAQQTLPLLHSVDRVVFF